MSFSEDPTQGVGSIPGADPAGTGEPDSAVDPTQGEEIGEEPYEDPTQGHEVGETPYEDPTQGDELGSVPDEDPTTER
jgi:hypothetical protein